MTLEHKSMTVYTVLADNIVELYEAIGEIPDTAELTAVNYNFLGDDTISLRLTYRDYDVPPASPDA